MIPQTLWVDSRTGSIELLDGLRALGLPAKKTKLDSGDFMWEGHGPEGPALVGVERKTLNDLVDSLRSGRLQGISTESSQSQLDRMADTFDFSWVLVEGNYTTDKAGRLVSVQRHGNARAIAGGFTEDILNKAMLSLDLRGGVRVKETQNRRQSERWLGSLFRSFTDKRWEQHTTMKTQKRPEKLHTAPISDFRVAVMGLCPGVIGMAASKAVERFCLMPGGAAPSFGILFAMTLVDWEDMEVQTPAGPRRLGTAKAVKVLEALRRYR